MCDPGKGELERQLNLHDRLKELEEFLKKGEEASIVISNRKWWITNASEIRRLLAPFATSQTVPPGTIIPERRNYKERRTGHNAAVIEHRLEIRRKLDRWNETAKLAKG